MHRTAILVLACVSAFAQQAPPAESSADQGAGDFVIRTETDLVLMPFYVAHKKKYVEGLKQTDIRLLEDGVEQKIALFEGPEVGGVGAAGRTVPVEITLLLDVSLSVMNRSLLDIYTLKEELLDGLGEGVSIAVYAFAQKLSRFTPPTRDIDKLQRALDAAYNYAGGGTRLYEAIMQTARDASRTKSNATRMLIVLSDGFPTGKQSPENAAQVAIYYGIPVYPVVLGHHQLVARANSAGSGGGKNPQPGALRRTQFGGMNLPGTAPRNRRQPTQGSERVNRARAQESKMAAFAHVGDVTGGRSFDPANINNKLLRGIFRSLVKQVQAEYVVGYYPSSSDAEKRSRQVKVHLVNEKSGRLYGGQRMVVH